jgi:hypothetical protein
MSRPRALWVWDIKTPQQEEPSHRLLSFCQKHNINLLFISCYALPERLEFHYRRFNRQAHAQGISVHALSGDPRWSQERFHHFQVRWIGRLLEFNAASDPTERFDGLHSDIEPYGLPKWKQQQHSIMTQYLALVDKSMSLIREAGVEEEMYWDVPFWWDDGEGMIIDYQGESKSAIRHIMERVSGVAIMDYRNQAEGSNGSIELVRGEFDIAKQTGVHIYLGQETIQDLEPPIVTFGNMSVSEMEEEIQKLEGAYNRYPNFSGIAMHHYVSYREMLER